MMTSQSFDFIYLWWWRILMIFVLGAQGFGLNNDGLLLLSFKYSILSDPFGALKSWNYHDQTPCSWNGVTCGTSGSADAYSRVTGLSLPDSELLGSIPATLGVIQHLRNLNLSNNSINGSIPSSLFSASELQILDFSNNMISGELPELVGKLKNLQVLNLSDNALAGNIPENLTTLQKLTVISLRNNYFFGALPGGFNSVQVLDLSSNLINGSLPPDFGGNNLSYFNVSYNRLSSEIPPEFATKIPSNATIDLSFNNLTGPIPESNFFYNQDAKSYSGNPELCGKPLNNPCPISSSIATPPNAPAPPGSPPAIAAIPKTIDSTPATASPGGGATSSPQQGKKSGLRTGTILGIVFGDVAGIGIIALIFMHVYHLKKRKSNEGTIKEEAESANEFNWASSSSSSEEYNWLRTWTCLKKQRHAEDDETLETPIPDGEEDEVLSKHQENHVRQEQKNGSLVTVDGEKELELETLLKASAYILGASGSSIMYKAVLEDGTTLAVRRIGENGVERFRDFHNQVRVIAKLVHPNLVQIRGFYWGTDEKLVIYDFVPNGSLANARYRKAGSSPCHLPWEMRLKIAKGVARGLCYIHEKKHVHGNLKPSNILFGPDMEPKIGDFGLERLVAGDNSYKAGGSTRNLGSKRSTASRDSFQDFASGATPSPSPSAIGVSPYHAPESLRSLKPNPKWDVFSFGVVLLELLTGKIIVSDEMGPGLALEATTSSVEEKGKVLRMADVPIRADVEEKEDAFLALLKLGYSCISPVPQKRPSMKEVLQALERFPTSSFSASYHYDH
ncbi:probable LRR receptor-like serine/threonine-protein kinase At4g37250 [Olea europaea var. sylvestris]|uniref:probable LRR receptor-like serine/threonine-protein kinase At4g37250 n=1 Tax=Olea europaea var. sylvestris TaxID=158386 RepID=UPI000C1D1F9F|nr:probable LRR receptor-like serine/threonine-protein kinase At4g37250 [Olea europaea var. sylvestris]